MDIWYHSSKLSLPHYYLFRIKDRNFRLKTMNIAIFTGGDSSEYVISMKSASTGSELA